MHQQDWVAPTTKPPSQSCILHPFLGKKHCRWPKSVGNTKGELWKIEWSEYTFLASLKPLEIDGYFWMFLNAFECIWILLDTFEYFWMLLQTPKSKWRKGRHKKIWCITTRASIQKWWGGTDFFSYSHLEATTTTKSMGNLFFHARIREAFILTTAISIRNFCFQK